MPRPVALLAVLALTALASCVRGNPAFQPDGFHDADLPVTVRYTDPGSRLFVGPDWKVDNFKILDDSRIGDAKDGPGFMVDREVDVDDDGKPKTQNGYVYELRLLNRVTTASIWIQAMVLAKQEKDRSLPSFLDDFVDNISGTGVYQATSRNPRKLGVTKTYGARVVDSKDTKTGRFESLDATLEVVNLDQLKVDPNAKSSIGRVVFVKTGYPYRFDRWARHGDYDTFVMVVVGCNSNPRDFEGTNADFTRFLGTIDLGDAPAAEKDPR